MRLAARTFGAFFLIAWLGTAMAQPLVLDSRPLQGYVERFNLADEEQVINQVSNARAFEFLERNVPLFECPDKDIERTFYFRWWTYRKSIQKTPDGFVILEFLPQVPWAGKHNTISCPAAHHFNEGRWLREGGKYLDDYAVFWFRKGGDPRRYSFWAADTYYRRAQVTGDMRLPVELLPDLIANYEAWERGWPGEGKMVRPGEPRLGPNGLFWQEDGKDGMEVSIGGSGYRATINSYMYGDAMAIGRIARLAGKPEIAARFEAEAARLKSAVQTQLWDEEAQFFKVLPREPGGAKLADVRELHGYTPWYFSLPDARYSVAWKQLMDPQGFYAKYGPTTAERRHPRFRFEHKHECLWNGPSWPFATSMTLTAMANLLNDYSQKFVSKKDYMELLGVYARSHQRKRENAKVAPWIDENLDPDTGEWIARSILHSLNRKDRDRGKDYNHSTFCDLVITGLVGLRPGDGNTVVVNPLVPEKSWDYFALDNVRYRNKALTIVWDRTGQKYNRGRGLRVYADGRLVASSPVLRRVTARLP
jgi:hypothetical protein